MQLAAGTQLDRYVVLDQLGEGGMATVWLVRHQRLNSLHALKILHSAKPSLRERLVREGQAQSGLRHSHVVAVTDVIDVDGMPGLVMEYVDGPDLSELLARRRLTLDEADALVRPMLDAVAAAHRAGLVHRDLKPGNVLLAIEDGRLRPKVTDFGLAKVLEDPSPGGHRTRSGVAMGTPAYMAPEQVRDASRVDERADVFALGCILYEMVTGRTAFTGADSFELLERVVRGAYEDVRSLRPDIPDPMAAAIHGALVADPDARIPSVDALREAWVGERSTAEPEWSALVEVARDLSAKRRRDPGAEAVSSDGNQTWTESIAPESAAASLASTPTTEPTRSWRVPLAITLLVAALASVAIALRPGPPPPPPATVPTAVMTSTEAVVISEDPVVQRQFEESWQAYLDADFRTAHRKLETVVASDPPAPMPWFLLAQVDMMRDDITGGSQAVWTAVDKARTHDSPLARLIPHLARMAVAEGWKGEHAEAYWDYLEAHPDDYFLPVIPLYSPASADAPNDVIERLFAEALARDPEPAIAYVTHASGLLAHGRWEAALAVAEQGLVRNPDSPPLLARKGMAQLRMGAFDEAQETLLTATRLDPGMIEARVDLALAAWASGDTALHTRLAEQLTGPLTPSAERGTYVASMAWALVGAGDIDGGLALLSKEEERAREEGAWPLALELGYHLSELQQRRGDIELWARALDRLRTSAAAPELSPDHRQRATEIILVRDAWLALARGDRDGAVRMRDRLAAIPDANPRNLASIDHKLAVFDGRPEDLHPEVFDPRCSPRIAYALDANRAGSADGPVQLEATLEDPTCSAIGRDPYMQSLAREALHR